MDISTQEPKRTLGKTVDPSTISPSKPTPSRTLGNVVDPSTIKPEPTIIPEHITQINDLPDDTEKLKVLDDQINQINKEKEKSWNDYVKSSEILGDPSDMPGILPEGMNWLETKDKYQQQIDSLKTLRNEIKNGLSIIQDPKIRDAVVASSMFTKDSTGALNNNFLKVKNKIGEPLYNKIERLSWDNAFDYLNTAEQKNNEEKENGVGLYNFNVLKNNKLKITPQEESDLKGILKEAMKDPLIVGNDVSVGTINYDQKRQFVDRKLKDFVTEKFPDKQERKDKYIEYSKAMNALMFVNPDNGKLSKYGAKTFIEDNLKQVNARLLEVSDIKNQLDKDANVITADGSDPIQKLIGTGPDAKEKYESYNAYKQRINDSYDKLKKIHDLGKYLLEAPEQRTNLRDIAYGKSKEIGDEEFITSAVKDIEKNLNIDEIKKKLRGEQGRYEPTWEEKKIIELHNGLSNNDFGQANENIQDLKTINWENKNFAQKFGVGIKSGMMGMKSGTEELISKAMPLMSLPTTPLHELFDPADMYLASEKIRDVALQDYKDRQLIYGKGAMFTAGTFAPLMAGTVAAFATAPFSGGSSLALIPAAISNTVLVGMMSDVVGNSLLEQEEYNKEKGIKDDDMKKWGIALAQGASMMLAGKIVGSSSKLLTNTVGKAMGLAFREAPQLSENLMRDYIKNNPSSWSNLAKSISTNMLKETGKQASTMGLMTATNDYVANLALNEEDKKKFETIVRDTWESAKAGAFFGVMIGPMTAGQSAMYKHLRNKADGLNIVQTKDGKIYERVGSDPENINSVIVLDKNLNPTKIKREDIVDWFSMTVKEKNKYLDAYKNNQKAMPGIEKSIRENAIRRQTTKIVDQVAYTPTKKSTSGIESSKKAGRVVRVYKATDSDGNEKQFYVTDVAPNSNVASLVSVEPRGDGTFEIKKYHPSEIDPSKITEIPAKDYIDMVVDYYTKIKPAGKKPSETTTGESPKPPSEPTGPDEPIRPEEPVMPEPEKENKNEIIKEKYKDLDEAGLLEESTEGEIMEPDFNRLSLIHDQLSDESKDLSRQMRDPSFKDLPLEKQSEIEYNRDQALTKIEAIEKHLDAMSRNLGTDFNDELPSAKHEILHQELASGKEITGKADMDTDVRMLVTLTDGRQVHAYINRSPIQSDIAEVIKEVEKKKQDEILKLRYTPGKGPNPGITTLPIGSVRYTDKGEKVKLLKHKRDKYGRGVDTFEVNDKEIHDIDYARLSHNYPDRRNEIVFASNTANPKEIEKKYDDQIAKIKASIPKTQEEQTKKIKNAIEKNKSVKLVLVRKQDWNPDDKVTKKVQNPHTGEVEELPYGDRIDVKIGKITVGSVQESDYNEKKKRSAKYQKAKKLAGDSLSNLAYKAAKRSGAIKSLVDINEPSLKKTLEDLVGSVATMAKIKAEEAFDWVKKSIKELNYTPEETEYVSSVLKLNEQNIVDWVNQKKIHEKLSANFKVKDVKPFKLIDFELEAFEGPAMSSAQKVDVHLKSYFKLWKMIAKDVGKTKDQVEHRFINLFHSNKESFKSVKNEETYQAWLRSIRTGDDTDERIADYLANIPFKKSVSIFNFYGSANLVKQIADIIDEGNNLNTVLLNTSDDYDVFVKDVENKLLQLGQREIKSKATSFKREINKRFGHYREMTPQQKIDAKMEQWERDLDFLHDITGIPRETWRQYYNELTQETYAYPMPFPVVGKDKKVNYKTYKNLLENETYRPGKDTNGNPWVQYQGDIVFQLLHKKEYDPNYKTEREYYDTVRKYFLQGDDLTNVLSNIYKLVTSQTGSNDIGMSGTNVKGDRMSSIIQDSDIINTAKNILNSKVDNDLVNYYKSIGKPMEISIINGIHNRAIGKSKEGNTSDEMSVEDIWISMLSKFGQGTDTYRYIIAQFSDKSTLYTADVPLRKNITAKEIGYAWALLEEAEGPGGMKGEDVFYKIADHIKYNVIALHQNIFKPYKVGPHDTKFSEFDPFINSFIVNYILNARDTQQLFFGEINENTYPGGFVMVTKRAGSFVSPGYMVNENIEGGMGHEFNFVLSNEQKFPDRKVEENINGQIFMSGSCAGKMQVSMGDFYSKRSQFPILDSVKAVMAFKHIENNLPELTKANIMNIDVQADKFGHIMPIYKKIKEFMDKNNIDMLSFPSSSKLHNGSEIVELFDEEGEINTNVKFDPARHIEKRATSTIIIQQDLRHSTQPKEAKEPSQFLTNMFSAKSASSIIANINEIQRRGLEALNKALVGDPEFKLQYVRDNANEMTQEDLISLLDAGITMDDPAYRSLMHLIMSSAIGKTALPIKTNRVTSQEIADVEGTLRVLEKTEDGLHVHLPDIIAGLDGAREDEIFEGTLDEVKNKITDNPFIYPDYIDDYGRAKEWALIKLNENKWIIRGEPIIGIRVPFTGLNSMVVGRLKLNVKGHNFMMKDKQSVEKGGLDYDGDSSYNQSFFRSNGKILFNPSSQGYMNEIHMNVIRDYEDPDMFDFITREINTKAYDPIVKRLTSEQKKRYNRLSPLSFMQVNLDAGVGVDLKGILTDHMTIYNLLNRYQVPVRGNLTLNFTGHNGINNIHLSRLARDRWGAMQTHISNLVNISFDNMKDPKMETMAWNEVTANIAILILVADSKLSSDNFENYDQHYNAIYDAINNLVDYLNSPLVKSFIYYKRRNEGGMRNETDQDIWNTLYRTAEYGEFVDDEGEAVSDFTKDDIDQLRTLYYASSELTEFRILYKLTQEGPKTYADYIKGKSVVKKVKFLLTEKQCKVKGIEFTGMKYFNTRPLFIEDKNDPSRMVFVPELSIATKVLKFCEEHIYNDMIEETIPGKQIIKHIFSIIKDKKKGLKEINKNDLLIISHALNRVFNVRAIGINKTSTQVSKQLFDIYSSLQENYPENMFLSIVRPVSKKLPSGNIVTKIGVEPMSRSDRRKIPAEILKEIRTDFDKLPAEVKDLFTAYTVYQYGANNSMSGGGFYKLLGIEHRVELSNLMTIEKNKWLNNELSSLEKFEIAKWVQRLVKIKEVRESTPDIPHALIADYYVDPLISHPTPKEALDSIENITTDSEIKPLDQYNAIVETYGLQGITEWARGVLGIEPGPGQTVMNMVVPAIKKYRENRLNMAVKLFGQGDPGKPVRDLMPGDRIMDLMLVDDPDLQNKIFEHLSKMYPGLELFKNEQAFSDYVNKTNGRLTPINMGALGHAFQNAIYVDPTSEVQEKMFHEMGHIYWDHLPEDHKVKQQLRDLYREDENFKDYDQNDLDEAILTDIGHLGTEQAPVYINPSLFRRFLNFVKDFWRAVKEFFGKFSKQDLINDLIHDIYTNKENIDLSSPEGEGIVRDMVQFDKSSIDANYDKPNHIATIGGKTLHSITTSIKGLQYFKFNPLEKMKQVEEKWVANYIKKNNTPPTPEMLNVFKEELKVKFDESGNAGSHMHAVAESVFLGKPLSPEAIKGFASQKVLDEFKRSLERFKAEIIQKYPNTTFYCEKELISPKYKMFGIADLIADIGDNRLFVFDYKTSEFEYKDAEGNRTDDYTKNYGMMKFPVSRLLQSKLTDHTIQLSIEAAILEEQRNEINPDAKNIIEGLFVIPVIREINENGLLTKARISNVVGVPGTDHSYVMPFIDEQYYNAVSITYAKNTAKSIMNVVSQKIRSTEKLFPKFEEDLKKLKINPVIRRELKNAISYFMSVANIPVPENPESIEKLLENITWHTMMDVSYNSDRQRYSRMLELGYDKDDIKALSPEAYLNIIQDPSNKTAGITKSRWLEEGKNLYKNVKVSERLRRIKNPNIPEHMKNQRYYHINIKGKDIYSHEAGTSDVKPGTKIVQIIQEKGPITMQRDYAFFTVSKVLPQYKTVYAINDKTDEEVAFRQIEKKEGLLIHDPDGHIPERKTTPNNFVQRLIPVMEAVEEEHWVHNIAKTADMQASEIKLHEFFSKYKTRADLLKLSEDYDRMVEWYTTFSLDKLTEPVMNYLRETINNHDIANQIREESKFGRTAMPMLLNAYWMLTNPTKATLDLSGWWKHADWAQPPALISAEFVGLNYAMLDIAQLQAKVTEQQQIVRRELNKIIDDNDNPLELANMTSTVGGIKYWVKPDNKNLTDSEKKFLEIVYHYYYTFNPKYRFIEGKELGSTKYPKQVQVEEMFRTREEFREDPKFGKTWGDIVYEILKPSQYDDTYVNLADKRHGEFIKNNDQMKWKDIKKQFVDTVIDKDSMDEDVIDEWLGPRKKFKYRNAPFLRKLGKEEKPITPGKLHYYYRQAIKNYEERTFEGRKIIPKQRRIAGINTQHKLFATKYVFESTEKAIESHIETFIMKRSVSVIDEINRLYTEGSRASNYLNDYVNANVFHQYKELGSELSLLTDYIIRKTSMAHIIYSITSMKMNFMAGQYMNVVYDGGAMMRGIGRFKTDFRKCMNILKLQNLVNLVDEAKFDELANMTGSKFRFGNKDGKGMTIQEALEFGYITTDIIEKLNQFPIYIGHMTLREFNAYLEDGTIRDPELNEHMSDIRKSEIKDRVQRLQGHYGNQNAASKWLTNEGKAIFQFRKYLPALLYLFTSPVHFNRYMKSDLGMIQALGLYFKYLQYNKGYSDDQRAQRFERILTESRIDSAKAKEMVTDISLLTDLKNRSKIEDEQRRYVLKSLDDYLDTLIEDRNGERLSWKEDMSEADQTQLRAAMISLAFLATTLAIIASRIGGGKDEKKWKNVSQDVLATTLIRFDQDMFIYGRPNAWLDMIAKPFASLDFMVSIGKFIVHFMEWGISAGGGFARNIHDRNLKYAIDNFFYPEEGVYTTDPMQNPGQFVPKGWPKFVRDAFGFVPAGGAVRSIFGLVNNIKDHQKVIATLKRKGFDPKYIKAAEKQLTEETTFKELREFNMKGEAERAAYIKSEMYKEYEKRGIGADLNDIQQYGKTVSKALEEISNYTYHVKTLNSKERNPEVNKEIMENAKKYDDIFGKKSTKPMTLQKENADFSKEDIKYRRLHTGK